MPSQDKTMHAICQECCKATLLQNLVRKSSTKGTCSLCGTANEPVLLTSDRTFTQAIKALIRYHYDEWDYHSKLGGDGFQGLLTAIDNPILKTSALLSEIAYEDFLLSFLDDIDNDQEIELFTAYGRDIYNYLAKRAIKVGEINLISQITSSLKKKNYYVVEAEFETQFKDLEKYVEKSVTVGTTWYRARIGALKKAAQAGYVVYEESIVYEPYSDKNLGAAPVGTTSAGRLNRPGVSYLYLATDAVTAMSEVRPHPSERVSVGQFQIAKKQRVADFTSHALDSFYESDERLKLLETIIAIENAFATAAPPSNRQVYSLTQFLAEMFRRIGFDGVKFRSTVGNGTNLVLFDPDACVWVDGSSQVLEVVEVEYKYVERQLYDPGELYDVNF